MHGYINMPIGGVMTGSSIQKATTSRFSGLLLRGTVLATYYVDDHSPGGYTQVADPVEGDQTNLIEQPPATDQPDRRHVYCDVLIYSGLQGLRKAKLHNVMVAQPGGGLHSGDIWVPRPPSINIKKQTADTGVNRSDPGDTDADHVLVGFLDDDLSLPIILGSVPHPARDVGITGFGDLAVGTRLKIADGQPRLHKHHGVVSGVDKSGNYVVNLTRAHVGAYDMQGREPRLPGDATDSSSLVVPVDGTSGNFQVRLRAGSSALISVLSDPADVAAPALREAFFKVESGRVELAVEQNAGEAAATPTRVVLEATTLTLDAQDAAGTVLALGVLTDLQTDQVKLGGGATEAVIKGDQYRLAVETMLSSISTALGQISTALAVLAAAMNPPPVPPPPLTSIVTALAALVTTQAAITQFINVDAPAALSVDVLTK